MAENQTRSIWTLFTLLVLSLMIVRVLGVQIFPEFLEAKYVPDRPEAIGDAELKLPASNEELSFARVWPQHRFGDALKTEMTVENSWGGLVFSAVRKSKTTGASAHEIFSYYSVPAAYVKGFARKVQQKEVEKIGMQVQSLPILVIQGYDFFKYCFKDDKCTGIGVLACEGNRVYRLAYTSADPPADPKALADAAEKALARMKSYAQGQL